MATNRPSSTSGSGGAPRENQGSSSPAAAAPPSWRCSRGGGWRERCWGGVVWWNLELGAAPLIAGARSMVDMVLGRSSGRLGSP